MSLSVPITWPMPQFLCFHCFVKGCHQFTVSCCSVTPATQSSICSCTAATHWATFTEDCRLPLNRLRGSVLGFRHSQWFAWSLCYMFPLHSQDGTRKSTYVPTNLCKHTCNRVLRRYISLELKQLKWEHAPSSAAFAMGMTISKTISSVAESVTIVS